MKTGMLGLLAVLLTACGDDGHVVGDMATGGTTSSATGETDGSSDTSSDDGSSSSSASATGGDSSSTSSTSNGTDSGSGGTSSSTTSSTNGSGGTSGDASTSGGGSGTSDTGSGGAAGASTGGSGGFGGSSSCAPGEMWCPGCYPGEGFCSVACPGSQCLDCADVASEEDCDARIDCHPVYEDPNNCFCGIPGCCAQYSACVPGGTADCEGADIACTIVEPHCENPAFVISYANGCYEGCVKPEECPGGTTTTGSGGTGSACDEACSGTADSANCADGEIYWYCGPTPSNFDDLDAECTSNQTPQPTWCCPASVRSQCL